MTLKPMAYLPKPVGRTPHERRLIDKLHKSMSYLEQANCLAVSDDVQESIVAAHESAVLAYERAISPLLEACSLPGTRNAEKYAKRDALKVDNED